MSRRILFLLMLALTCSFMLVGCGGSDGSDGKDGADADQTAIIAALKAQLESGAITIAQYESAIAALEAELAATGKITAVESCATCHDSGKANDPAHEDLGMYAAHSYSAPEGRELVPFNNPWKTAEVTAASFAVDGTPTVSFTVKSTNSAVVFDAADSTSVALQIRRFNATTGRWNSLVQISNTTTTTNLNLTIDTAAAAGNAYTTTATIVGVAAQATVATAVTAGEKLLVTVYAYDSAGTAFVSEGGRTFSSLKAGFRAVKVYDSATTTLAALDSATNPRNYISDTSANPSCSKCHGVGEFNMRHNNTQRADGDDCVSCHIGRANDGDEFTPEYQLTANGGNSALVNRIHGVHASKIFTYVDGTDTKTGYIEGEYNVGFPSNMSECSVCHTTAAQLANATNNANFTASLCVSCHGTAFWKSEPIAAALTAGTIPPFHVTQNYDYTTDCQTACHEAGGVAASATLASVHGGNLHNMEVSLGKDIAYEIQSVSITGNTGKVTWRAYNTATSTNYDVLSTETTAPVFNNIVGTSRAGQSYATSILIGYYTGDDLTNQGNTTQGGQPGTTVNITGTSTKEIGTTNVFETTFPIPATVTATKGIVAIQGVPVVWSGGTGYLAIVDSVTKNFNKDNSAATARRSAVDINLCLNCHTDFLGHGHNRINNIELCVTCHNANATDKDPRTKLAAGNVGGTAGTGQYNTTVDGKAEESYDLKVMLHSIHSATAADAPYMVYRTRGIFTFYGEDLPAAVGQTGNAAFWSNIKVEYPRAISTCTACHTSNGYQIADQTKAVAVTVGAGTNLASHADDTVIGPNAAACTSCHRGEISDSAAIRAHATTFGYKTNKSTKNEILQLAQ